MLTRNCRERDSTQRLGLKVFLGFINQIISDYNELKASNCDELAMHSNAMVMAMETKNYKNRTNLIRHDVAFLVS